MARIYSPTGWRVLEASGLSVANDAYVSASTATFSLINHGDNYEHLELELVWIHAVAPTANSALTIFAQDLQVNTTNDAQPPSNTHIHRRVAAAPVANVTTTQAWRGDIIKAPLDARYHVHGTGITNAVTAGWTLRARAFKFA